MSELNKKNDKLISMMAAIDALCHRCDLVSDGTPCTKKCNDIKILEMLPSAQPERLTDDDFETIRIHLNAVKESLCNQSRWKEAEEYQKIIDRFMSFASAQPVIRCKDCKHFGGGTYCYERDGMWDENDFCSYAERRGGEDDEDE